MKFPVATLASCLTPPSLLPALPRARRLFCTTSADCDAVFMRAALVEAEAAFAACEVPIGAVLVRDGTVIAAARNQVEELRDASAHAEMLCMRAAADVTGTWRLNHPNASTLYVTLEPCPMCLAALHAFRVDRLVYAAPNARMGAIESSLHAQAADDHPYPSLEVTSGVLAEPAAELMRRFFKERRMRATYNPHTAPE